MPNPWQEETPVVILPRPGLYGMKSSVKAVVQIQDCGTFQQQNFCSNQKDEPR